MTETRINEINCEIRMINLLLNSSYGLSPNVTVNNLTKAELEARIVTLRAEKKALLDKKQSINEQLHVVRCQEPDGHIVCSRTHWTDLTDLTEQSIQTIESKLKRQFAKEVEDQGFQEPYAIIVTRII